MKKSLTYKSVWHFNQVEYDFIFEKCVGETYNFFAGEAHIGTRVDVDKKRFPDILCDLTNKYDRSAKLGNLTWDTALIDPPFIMWIKFTKIRAISWLYFLASRTRKRIILVGPWTIFGIKNFRLTPPNVFIGKSGAMHPILIYERNPDSTLDGVL